MIRSLLLIVMTVTMVHAGFAEAAPATSGDWKRLLNVDRWLLEYSVHCDDQYTWQQSIDRKSWALSAGMTQTIELVRKPGQSRWLGRSEAKLRRRYHARTDIANGEWWWNREEGGGVLLVSAELDIWENGYRFRFGTPKETVFPEGVHTGESYRLTGKGWVLDPRQNTSRIHPPSFFLNGLGWLPHPEKGLVLAGTKRDAWGGNKDGRPNVSLWHWRLVPLETELLDVVIEPSAGYEEWLPRAGESESRAGAQLEVTARLVSRDGKPPRRKAKRFIFELDGVSAEPGTCLNHPLQDAAATPDIAFEAGVSRLLVSSEFATRGETAAGSHLQATAVVSCFDHGAYGELRVTAEMEDGEWIHGTVRSLGDRTSLPIPFREGGSKVATAWLRDAKVLGYLDADDSENAPVGDGFLGDGLTLYEEYRGFIARGGYHRRANPKQKELYVSDQLADADAAFTRYEKLSGIAVNLVPRETREDRVLNANRSANSPQRTPQHYVILGGPVEATDHADFMGGSTKRESNGRRKVTPISVRRIVIQPGGTHAVKALGADGRLTGIPYRELVIVHELLHATGAEHHGEGDKLGGVTWSRSPDGAQVLEGTTPVQVFRESVTPVPLRAHDDLFHQPMQVVLAVPGGAFSGDQACIMRYAGPHAFVFPDHRSTRRCFIAHDADEAWGLGLCTSAAGTGVNAPDRAPAPRYGAATRGNCAGQLRVSDAP